MESTETTNQSLSIEDAVQGLIAPTEEAIENIEEETQATEVETEEVEATAESDIEDIADSDETDEEVEEIEASAEDEIDNDYEEDAVQESNEELIAVKVDGQIREVTLDELKQGYSGQEYVQKGMQDAANQRKEAEAVYQALLADRQQVGQLLQQMQEGNFAKAPEEPSKELFDTDPIGYMEEKMKYEEKLKEYNAQMQQVEQVMKQQTQAQQTAKQAYMKSEMEELTKVIPEFGDPKKAETIKNKLLTSGAKYYGYQANEIGQVMDHRAIRVLNDAIKYREIMEGKNKAATKTTGKRVVKAGAKKVDDSVKKARQKQMAKLKQTGSINDAISLMFK